MATAAMNGERSKQREEWLRVVSALIDEVESWAVERKWPVHRESKPVYESALGRYKLPILTVLTPTGPVRIDPVARYVAGADGLVDLLGWPTMTRMMLLRKGKGWVLKTDDGRRWPKPWGPTTFTRLVERLNPAA